MANDRLLAETLGEFARTMVHGYAISDVLHDLVQRAVVLVRVEGAGVSLHEDGRLRFVTAVDERTTKLEQIQERERGLSVDDAFQLLRRYARSHSSSLRTVAEAVVNLGLRP